MLHLVVIPLSSPRFTRWALENARRQNLDGIVCVLNGAPREAFGELEDGVTWLESAPGKPNAMAAAGEWLAANAPDALVVQHDQDDWYPEGSAQTKLAALADYDIVGAPMRRIWVEHHGDEVCPTRLTRSDDYWDSWGGSYAWRASAFVPRPGPSEMYDDTYWVRTMVDAGARWGWHDAPDVYCRWLDHRHVWQMRGDRLRETLQLEDGVSDPAIRELARACGCLTLPRQSQPASEPTAHTESHGQT